MDPGLDLQREYGDALTAQFADRSKIIVKFFLEKRKVPIIEAVMEPVLRYDAQTGNNVPTGQMKPTGDKRKVGEKWANIEMVEIRAPGQKDEIRRREVRESDKLSWPELYERFQKREEQPIDGTPLEMVPFLRPADVEDLLAAGLRTAENVAAVADVNDSRLGMGFVTLKQKMRDFLAVQAGSAPVEALRSQLEQERAEKQALLDRVAALEQSAKAAEQGNKRK